MATQNYHEVEVDPNQITELRNKFLQQYATNSQEYDARDIEERIKANDWYVKRYILLHPTSLDKALAEMMSVYKWRKQMAVNDMYQLDKGMIAIEPFKMPTFFISKPDQAGNITM